MNQLDSRKIAYRYAKALFQATEEAGLTEAVTDILKTYSELFQASPEQVKFFATPGIPTEEKLEVLNKALGKSKAAQLVKQLLSLLAENNRLETLGALSDCYIEMVHEKEGQTKAQIITPVPLNSRLREQFRKTLQKIYNHQEIELIEEVDPSILAGAIVRIGDKLIDGSYLGKLKMLRKQVG